MNKYQEFREALNTCRNPVFFFDDDADGLASFLLLYRYANEGRGIIVKTVSTLTREWALKAKDADKVFVLDIPSVDQDFIDELRVPVYWLDHHMPVERKNVNYINPRIEKKDAYIPTSRIAYEIVQQDLWISAIGCVADWHIPDFAQKFRKEYPGLLPNIKDPGKALFTTKTGTLARMFSFFLKGKDNMKFVKVLTRIKSPYELLEAATPQAKFLMRHFSKVNGKYEALLKEALDKKSMDKLFIFNYSEDHWSFTSDLSTELSFRKPKKVILVCRNRNGEYKCSLRSRSQPILQPLQHALQNVEGRGGGHEYAAGVTVKSGHFEIFVERLRKALNLSFI